MEARAKKTIKKNKEQSQINKIKKWSGNTEYQ